MKWYSRTSKPYTTQTPLISTLINIISPTLILSWHVTYITVSPWVNFFLWKKLSSSFMPKIQQRNLDLPAKRSHCPGNAWSFLLRRNGGHHEGAFPIFADHHRHPTTARWHPRQTSHVQTFVEKWPLPSFHQWFRWLLQIPNIIWICIQNHRYSKLSPLSTMSGYLSEPLAMPSRVLVLLGTFMLAVPQSELKYTLVPSCFPPFFCTGLTGHTLRLPLQLCFVV